MREITIGLIWDGKASIFFIIEKEFLDKNNKKATTPNNPVAAEISNKTFIPSHSLAVSTEFTSTPCSKAISDATPPKPTPIIGFFNAIFSVSFARSDLPEVEWSEAPATPVPLRSIESSCDEKRVVAIPIPTTKNRINNAIQIMEEMIKSGIFINNDIHLFN